MYRILIVEDEKPISNLIKISLSSAGYLCNTAFDGLEAADTLEDNRYDLILLDVMLPKVNGYELMEYIRSYKTPVIFLTAKGKVEEKVKGLKLGAEDYITKPFEILELLARVETILRRYHKQEEEYNLEGIVINTSSFTVKRGEVEILLTQKEFMLLILFAENRNLALFREQIYERVWGGEYTGDSRTVDLHVQRLRKKLGWHKQIIAVQKVGYRLEI
ncbi:MAG: response regulator transcription factor [Herbinix sp.]|nr:response regulator transcription factor [Herbinix sp.]